MISAEYQSCYDSPLGGITLESDGEALTGLWFDDPQPVPGITDAAEKKLPVFDLTEKWLDLYFSGKKPDFTPPLKLIGTPFRKAVWEILLTIPYGRTMTYGEIARLIAARRKMPRMSAQAVGGAVGHNPVSLIVPCHRVIGAAGKLVGYGGGLDRKVRLLALEGIVPGGDLR
ncbi:MAG: methylated-DNA--[Lentisphaeria bacterium]|nr:methylated-DNA--[protein]-cysteine S-methyltransferase [Lentisphaeria bacterium]